MDSMARQVCRLRLEGFKLEAPRSTVLNAHQRTAACRGSRIHFSLYRRATELGIQHQTSFLGDDHLTGKAIK